MKNASETTSEATRASEIGNAISVFIGVLLSTLIVGALVWYVFGVDFFKVMAVSLTLATLFSLVQVLDVGWFQAPLLTMILGLVVAIPVGLVFGSIGFFAVSAVFFVLSILTPLLMGENGREEARREWKKRQEDIEREEQRQQEVILKEAEQEQLKQALEQVEEKKNYRIDREENNYRNPFPARPQELRALPYKDYLHTPHWKRKRESKLRAVGHRCQVCDRRSGTLDVHHRTYDRLGKELDEDLTVLCRECHNIFHEQRRLGR